jgi:lysophospholipase L1-like esterase
MMKRFLKKIFSRENLFRLLLVVVSIALSLAAGEYGLRFYLAHQNDNKYYVWPPNMRIVYRPAAGIMPGVTREGKFSTSREGIRGDDLSDRQTYRILAIGGSTTECLYIDQELSWPYALQRKLNGGTSGVAWVGNVGKSGLSTREHYMHMKYLLPQLPKIDTIVMLTGGNDLLRRLIEDTAYDPDFLGHYDVIKQKIIRGAFSLVPYFPGKYRLRFGYYDETAIGSLYKQWRQRRSHQDLYQDQAGTMFVTLRKQRKEGREFVDTLPDLTSALGEYRRNLNTIIDMAKAGSIRIVFMTQPSLWRPDLTEREKDLLWCGWIESQKSGRYYTIRALMEGMQRYNDTLLDVCRKRGVECIDLARIVPKDTSAFYDDLHFNEAGNALVAETLARALQNRPGPPPGH